MRGQTNLKSMKKGVIWIENTGENLYKMLKPSVHSIVCQPSTVEAIH